MTPSANSVASPSANSVASPSLRNGPKVPWANRLPRSSASPPRTGTTCVNDPDIAALPEFALVEQRALDVLLVGDPGALTRAHRTLVVTAAMRLTVVNGEPVTYTPDPLDELRGSVAKHVLDWTVRTATL